MWFELEKYLSYVIGDLICHSFIFGRTEPPDERKVGGEERLLVDSSFLSNAAANQLHIPRSSKRHESQEQSLLCQGIKGPATIPSPLSD